jgi:hypothetical protein
MPFTNAVKNNNHNKVGDQSWRQLNGTRAVNAVCQYCKKPKENQQQKWVIRVGNRIWYGTTAVSKCCSPMAVALERVDSTDNKIDRW